MLGTFCPCLVDADWCLQSERYGRFSSLGFGFDSRGRGGIGVFRLNAALDSRFPWLSLARVLEPNAVPAAGMAAVAGRIAELLKVRGPYPACPPPPISAHVGPDRPTADAFPPCRLRHTAISHGSSLVG